MTNKALILTEDKIKKSAKRLKNLIENKNYNQCLQLISQSFFSKSFEEIKKTLLNDNSKKNQNKVFLIHYNNQILLTLNNLYILDLNSNISINDIYSEANKLAEDYSCLVNKIYLPLLFGDQVTSADDILSLTKKMGYFDNKETIFDLLNKNNIKIFVNDIHCPYTISEDWHDKCFDEGEEACIWFIEMQEGFEYYEFFITFKELCNAYTEDYITWFIPYEKYTLKIDIF